MKSSHIRFARALRGSAAALGALALLHGAASAQTFDAQIGTIEVAQALPESALTIPLTAGRSTYIRVEALLTNPPSDPVDLDGIMRVFINGVEAPDSPVFSRNGPFPAKTNPNFNVRNGTLNFMYLPPASNDIVFEIELNPPGPNFVPESNTTNNIKATASLNFANKGIPEFAYVPIDYRPGGGGTPNLPNEALIKPGVGDNFIQGIYPAKDIYYHRTVQPSMLWTNSLNGTGSGLLNALQNMWVGMSPRPDFLYGWVPGSLPYNGQAFLNSAVSMGNTQSIRHQRTYAHEVGHNVGLSHTSWTILDRGVDQEHHLNITEGLPFIKIQSLRNIMDAGLLTQDAWVRDTHYQHFYNHPKFASPEPPAPPSDPVISVTGVWDVETRTMKLDPLYLGQAVHASTSVDTAVADFEFTVYRDGAVAQRLYATSPSVTDSCSSEHVEDEPGGEGTDSALELPNLAFNALITQGDQSFDRLVITPMGRVEAEPIVLDRTPNAPVLQFLSPAQGQVLDSTVMTLQWAASDADGDELSYWVRYSRDGQSFVPLTLGAIRETSLVVDLDTLAEPISGVSFFEVQATDGLNFTVARSPSLVGSSQVLNSLVNDPWVHISTPDSGKSYQKGAVVILHAQGWDIEDRQLEGNEMVWSSSLDGQIATGRLASIDSLSVGTHVLTVVGTDSNGNTAQAQTTVTINDRGLPGQTVSFYCTAGTSASGCQATMSATGTPSATAPTGFTVSANNVEGAKDGLFFFGTNGRQANSWGSGTSFQCVVPPTNRTSLLTGSGTVGLCDGLTSRDMNATWTAIPAKNPGAGAVVQLQFWYRDPLNTSNQTTSLSDAVEFIVQP